MQDHNEAEEKLIALLFRTYFIPLCSYARRFVGRKDVAEDIVADTFFKIWKNQKKISLDKSLKSYLFQAVYNNSIYYLRQLKNEGKLDDYFYEMVGENIGVPQDMDQPFKSLILKELEERIEKAVGELPPQQQKAFRLKRFEGLKLSEVAEKMEISVKTVEMHLSKALLSLRNQLKSDYDGLLFFLLSEKK